MAIEFENLYLLELKNESETFYKIGTTVHRYSRFYQIMKFGYRAKIIHMLMGLPPLIAWDMEKYIQDQFIDFRYSPLVKFGGHTECFRDVSIDYYKHLVSGLNPVELVENIEISWR